MSKHISSGILIRQNGSKCEVVHCETGDILFSGGRVRAKYYALGAAEAHDLPVYNQKQSGEIVACTKWGN